MASWHKRARIGVAIFGLVVAGIVYAAMGERRIAPPAPPIERMDPEAVAEISNYLMDRITGTENNFEIRSERTRTYEDGSTKQFGLTILVPKGDDRTFTITAAEGEATGKEHDEIALGGGVRMEDSDGFVVHAETATFDRQASIARAPGAVTFSKGRMRGSGAGITYDDANQILEIAEATEVVTTDEAGKPVMELAAGGTATLDRAQHLLTLDTAVHVVRGEQIIDTDHAVARLSDTDDAVTFVELRGNARVEGGASAVDAMSARDIDLDYTEDGQTLEAVALAGDAAVAMIGRDGAAQQIVSDAADVTLAPDGSRHLLLNGGASIAMIAASGGETRRIAGELLDLDVAADGSVTRAVGRDDVQLDLPAAQNGPVRRIRAQALDGSGQPGAGLTSTTFDGDVVFTEEARGSAPRTARAQRLEASLASDAVTRAIFTGDVTFEEPGLKACAARLAYQPDKGILGLSGATGAGNPRVAEEQIAIEARTIDVALAGRRMTATGGVKTHILSATPCQPATPRAAADRRGLQLPGLFDAKAAASATAGTLDYQGEAGIAVFSGDAKLWQGASTAIYGDTLTIDQGRGELVATGSAKSVITLDGGQSNGVAHEIRYADATRTITFAGPPRPAPATPGAAAPPAPVPPPAVTDAHVSGPEGDLRADRIQFILTEDGGGVDRIEAFANVRATVGTRTVTGGARLTYYADEGKYEITGLPPVPVVIIERVGQACRPFAGNALTFFASSDRILIDGKDMNRVQTAPAACPAAVP